jgi:hypothetical protein
MTDIATMHLVQILLPLSDNEHHPFPRAAFDRVAQELTERFGGVTAHTRAPAEGRWTGPGTVGAEEVVVVEVMVEGLDDEWWSHYRRDLEVRFRQHRILVRAQVVRLL